MRRDSRVTFNRAEFTGSHVNFVGADFTGGQVDFDYAGRAGGSGRRIKGKLWSGLSVSSTSLLCIKRLVVEAFS